MKTKLQKQLAKIAPSIAIETYWEYDTDLRDIRQDCDGMDDENPDDWQAWQSNIRATVIQDGEEIHGNAYLGGTWEKTNDLPEYSNPTISGYEPQMTLEALEELPESAERDKAIDWLKVEMRGVYEEQMATA
jgi:hypothetical protein